MPERRSQDWVGRHVVHLIATGKYAPGDRMPSVRQAEAEWGASRLTVLRAYRRLAEQGILRGQTTTGYFVIGSSHVTELREHQRELDGLYTDVAKLVLRRGGPTLLGTLRHLTAAAEAETRAHPECGFVECTPVQSRAHAEEIEARLRIPCAMLTTTALRDAPTSLRVLVTTAFHRAEVTAIARRRKIDMVEVEIEMASSLRRRIEDARDVVFFGVTAAVIEHVATDLGHTGRHEQVAPDQLDRALTRAVRRSDRVVVLSPSLWEARPPAWHDHPALVPVTTELTAPAWPRLAEALGVPLG